MNVKEDFPFFKNNPGVIYLDSGATTQKPQSVINTITEFYEKYNANAGRGSYQLSSSLSQKVEEVREKVKDFLGAKSRNEIVFTSGATESLNFVALTWGLENLKDQDEILFSEEDHKSSALPWFNLKKILQKQSINIKLIPYKIRNTGGADIEDIKRKISNKTKLIQITHVHNVYGTDSDIKELSEIIKDRNILLSVDASQSVGHINVNVKELNADFLSFSGHKMFASQGIGVLYIKKKLHSSIKPIFAGGGVGSSEINENNFIYGKFPEVLESGTLNYEGILSLGSAIDYIESIGIQKIHFHLAELTQYLLENLKQVKGIEFLPGPYYWKCAGGNGILSFKLDMDSSEVGFILGENGIYVRTGNHCRSIKDKNENSVRISMHVYNTKDDIDKLTNLISKL